MKATFDDYHKSSRKSCLLSIYSLVGKYHLLFEYYKWPKKNNKVIIQEETGTGEMSDRKRGPKLDPTELM